MCTSVRRFSVHALCAQPTLNQIPLTLPILAHIPPPPPRRPLMRPMLRRQTWNVLSYIRQLLFSLTVCHLAQRGCEQRRRDSNDSHAGKHHRKGE